MPVTIREVARRAEVSVKTVSRVINNEPRVHAATRAKVMAAMHELGYVPNISAQRLARGHAHIIGVIFPRDTGAYFNTLVHDLLLVGKQVDYEVLLHPTAVGSNGLDGPALDDAAMQAERAEVLQLWSRRQVDGLLLITPCDSDPLLLDQLQAQQCPYVRLFPQDRARCMGKENAAAQSGDARSGDVKVDSALPYVAIDDEGGARAITEHLLALGHRRIGFIGGPARHRASTDRLRGYQAALAAHGLTPEAELIRGGDFQFEDGIRHGRALLALDARPTAIFAANDDMAAGVIVAGHEAGLAIPADLSVVGFDDGNLASQIWPPLTTVRNPSREIAQLALHLLLQLLTGDPLTETELILPTEVVVRRSTAAPCTAQDTAQPAIGAEPMQPSSA